jgi:hypothetical protein
VFDLSGAGTGTEVVWTMTGPQTMMTRVVGIFSSMDKMLGSEFEKGLAQLKADAESDPASGADPSGAQG